MFSGGIAAMPEVEKKMWGIHTLDDNLFLKEDVIAIGWKEIGNLRDIPATREDIKSKYLQVFPDAK